MKPTIITRAVLTCPSCGRDLIGVEEIARARCGWCVETDLCEKCGVLEWNCQCRT